MRVRLIPFALLVATLAFGCEEERPEPPFRVTFLAESDGEPLAATRIIADGNVIGETGRRGLLRVDLRGREGQAVSVNAQCPEGFRPPAQLPLLTLRRFRGLDPATAERGIEMTIECPPGERVAALVVRAGGQPDLPVLMRGREIGRTDASGAAHLVFRMRPNTSFRVQLDTSQREDLRPQNPGQTFAVPDNDEILVFDQPFEVQTKRRPPRRPPPVETGPRLPIRLQ